MNKQLNSTIKIIGRYSGKFIYWFFHPNPNRPKNDIGPVLARMLIMAFPLYVLFSTLPVLRVREEPTREQKESKVYQACRAQFPTKFNLPEASAISDVSYLGRETLITDFGSSKGGKLIKTSSGTFRLWGHVTVGEGAYGRQTKTFFCFVDANTGAVKDFIVGKELHSWSK